MKSLRFAFVLLLLLCASTVSFAAQNVVVVLVDDLGYTDLACYGSSLHETPNVDRLAASGMRFTDGYAAHPVCSPTRAAIMTGKNPARIRITDWIPGSTPKNRRLIGPQDQHQLALSEVTIAERFQSAGYKTFYAGKWHLGDTGFFPEDQGFDQNKGGHHKGSPPGGYYSPYKNPKLANGPKGEYLPDRLTDETLRFIEKNKATPFFAYLAFYTVHTPIQASRRHIEKYKEKVASLPEQEGEPTKPEHDGFTRRRQDNAAFASMVAGMDENIGRLLDKLEALDLAKNTIVVFTSDNGGLSTLPGKRTAPTSNAPLRAGKGWCYEGGIRVPFIIRAPGVTTQGGVNDTPVNSADLYPTLLELTGLELNPKQHVDGVSLLPLLSGRQSMKRGSIVWHYPHYHGSAWTPGSAIRSGPWKLIEFYDKEKVELYNLKKDLSESHDLSKEMPEKAAELRKELQSYLKSVDAQMPRPNASFKK